jgi:hypothetical protein
LLRLGNITCVIDAEAVFADGDNEGLNSLKLRQIAFADTELDEWGGMTPRTQIVAIGSNGSLGAQELGNKFDACIKKFPNPIDSSSPKSWKKGFEN